MWFYDSDAGTFCVRYMREGYGLFLDGQCLNWFRDADSAAAPVAKGQTGRPEWDGLEGVKRPAGLAEWRHHDGTGSPINAGYDSLIVPLACSCGHEFKESVVRLKNIPDIHCPSCGELFRMETDRLLELIRATRLKQGKAVI